MNFLRDLYFFRGKKYTSFGKNILLRQSTSLGHSSTGHPGGKSEDASLGPGGGGQERPGGCGGGKVQRGFCGGNSRVTGC